jgi:hypothetical protein
MKSYNEIDVEETPIVVLGCGHFFTAETLDGHVGIGAVYAIDGYGEFTGLRDTPQLAHSIPRCPDCQCPIRQYVTQRYNRVINRAVIDEMSKRFLVDGQDKLRVLEQQTNELEQSLEKSREHIIRSFHQTSVIFSALPNTARVLETNKELHKRYEKSRAFQRTILSFCKNVADSQQPAQKLYSATVNAARRRSITDLMADLDILDDIPAMPRDRRITIGGRLAQIKADCIIIKDIFSLHKSCKSSASKNAIKIPGGKPNQLAKVFFQTCGELISDCMDENLRKLSVQGTLHYASLVRLHESYCRSQATEIENAPEHVTIAKGLLEVAKRTCAHGFENADILLDAVEESIKLLGKEWYEEVTADELAAIKTAMVSGPNGIATHTGHWYNCANGHPVSPLTL